MLPDPLHNARPDIVRGAVRVAPDAPSIWVIDDLVVGPRLTAKPPPRVPSPAVALSLLGGGGR